MTQSLPMPSSSLNPFPLVILYPLFCSKLWPIFYLALFTWACSRADIMRPSLGMVSPVIINKIPQGSQHAIAQFIAAYLLFNAMIRRATKKGPNPLPKSSSDAYSAIAAPLVSGKFTLSRTGLIFAPGTAINIPWRKVSVYHVKYSILNNFEWLLGICTKMQLLLSYQV